MTQITEKQLIESLSQLKEIKPRKEWAILLKSQILAEQKTEPIRAESVSFMSAISAMFVPRRMAYSLAVLLFLIIGIFGVTKFLPTQNVAKQSTASLAPQTAMVIKSQIGATLRSLEQNLKANPTQDPQTIKVLAKTLADMPGDIAYSKDVQNLYQTVIESQIADMQKTTLTDSQTVTLKNAEDLYAQGKYADALEQILLINK